MTPEPRSVPPSPGDNGGPAGLAAAWARHGHACYQLARQVTGQDTTAGQAVQQAFAALAGGHDGTRPDPGGIRAWLLDATHQHAAAAARRQPPAQRRQRAAALRHALDPLPPPGPPSPPGPPPPPGPLHAALAALPPASRETLALAWAGGYTCQQIAELTGDTPAAVLTRLHQALARVAGNLDPRGQHTAEFR